MYRRRLAGVRQRGLLSLVVVILAVWVVPATAKTYDHPAIEQVFRLLPNGDAEVEDLRTFRFEGSFSWAELRLHTTGQYGRYDVQFLGVWDADSGRPLRIDRSSDGGDRILRWYYQAENETRRFLLRYRILGAVQLYGDVAQFYWKAIEDDHAPIGRVHIAVIPPRASPALFKVFVHSRAAPGDLVFAADFSRAAITQTAIPGTSFVEVRALLDPAGFSQAPVRTGETVESLLADERRQSQRTLWLPRLLTAGSVLAGLLIVALVVAFLWVYLRYGKEWGIRYETIYEREPPRPLPPAVVPAILTQSKAQPAEMPKAFAATLIEAGRLGYLEIEETQERGKDMDLVFRLTDRGRALLQGEAKTVGPSGVPPAKRPLEPFEVEVLQMVFRRAGKGQIVTSDEVEAWGKRMAGNKSNFLLFVERWGPQLREWFEQKFFPLDDPASERARVAFIGVTIAVLIVVFFAGMGVSMIVGVPVGGVLIALAWKTLARRTPQAALEVKRWDAFRRFMTDFSAMKDAGPQLLPLWEHYLVYATALGVADQLLSNFKLVAAELHQTLPATHWYRPRATPDAGGLSIASLESMAHSFENFRNLSRARSSSSRTGGGFSGGGGGGGGGGGSRAG